jgi:hypothetical protein
MNLPHDVVMHNLEGKSTFELSYVSTTTPPSTNGGIYIFRNTNGSCNVAIVTKHSMMEDIANKVVTLYFLSQWLDVMPSFFFTYKCRDHKTMLVEA